MLFFGVKLVFQWRYSEEAHIARLSIRVQDQEQQVVITMTCRFFCVLVMALFFGYACGNQVDAVDPPVYVQMQTDLGVIELEIDVARAPISAGNFLRYVDEGRFEGAHFYRVVRQDNQPNSPVKIEVIQGGLGFQDDPQRLPEIAHETTEQTGLKHLDGTLSMARAEPGTASSEFFICVGDQPELDFGGKRNPDGQGFAAFGRVVRGMDVVRKIQEGADDGQLLKETVAITRVERINKRSDGMSDKREIATLGAGCFWCVEAVYQDLRGVHKVASGYMGGSVENPTYQQVCTGTTGHAEVIQVTFDPEVISFEEILYVFWRTHNPTTLNRQGNDVGTQYRSAIFYHDDGQKGIAEKSKSETDASDLWSGPIVTEIAPAGTFYVAEDYHQNYFKDNPYQPYCMMVINPKVQKFQKSFGDWLKEEKK